MVGLASYRPTYASAFGFGNVRTALRQQRIHTLEFGYPTIAKSSPQPDVLVLGQHPSAYLASILLRTKSPLSVAQITIPGEGWPDRLTLINPGFFNLHPSLSKL